jgi:hypothetical protein
VQTGYLYALKNGYEIAVQMDGDGQHDARYLGMMEKISLFGALGLESFMTVLQKSSINLLLLNFVNKW